MNKNPIKCDDCGRFISYESLASGDAIYEMVLPESHVSEETWVGQCKRCIAAELKSIKFRTENDKELQKETEAG